MIVSSEPMDSGCVEPADRQQKEGAPTLRNRRPARVGRAMLVDMFWDLSNIEITLRSMGQSRTDYGQLRDFVLNRFCKNVGLPADHEQKGPRIRQGGNARATEFDSVLCRYVWCVSSIPINYHPNDVLMVQKRLRFLAALRKRHQFHVDTVPVDFRHHRIRAIDRAKAHDSGSQWRPKEDGVDMQLAVRLLRQCEGSCRPDGVILVSGDSDFAPALYDVVRRDPPIVAVVAGFSKSMAEVYLTGNPAGYSWRYPPIFLDDFTTWPLASVGDMAEETVVGIGA